MTTKTKDKDIQERRIKCYKCKDYFDSVIIFKENQEEDYKNKKWYCQDCFSQECGIKGYNKCLAEVEKMIDELENIKTIGKEEVSLWISAEELKQKLKELNNK